MSKIRELEEEIQSKTKKTVTDYLNEVDYGELNKYAPSKFALGYITFLRASASHLELNETPAVHFKMLDGLISKKRNLVNLCHRGLGKSFLMGVNLVTYLAVFQHLPNFGSLNTMLFVGDTMENGAKNLRKGVESLYEKSPFLQEYLPKAKFTDNYIEFENADGKPFGVKLYGAKALSLDTAVYTKDGWTTIGEVNVGEEIIGADGKLTTILDKSEIFYRPMYQIQLRDGRTLDVCEEHLNQVWVKKFKSERTFSTYTLTEGTYSTKELLGMDMFATDTKGCQRPLLWIENVKPMEFQYNHNLLIDPYTVGVLIGDGSMNTKSRGDTPVVLTAHIDDWYCYEDNIPYQLGLPYKQNNTISRTIIGIGDFIVKHGLNKHGNLKEIPEEYLFSSIEQRLSLLQGLMDTDGSAFNNGKCTFSSNSKKLVEQVMWLVRSLGGYAYMTGTGRATHFRCTIELDMPLFRLKRKLERQKHTCTKLLPIMAITRIDDVPSQCIKVSNSEEQFVAGKSLVRTHNTGVRGVNIFNKRPELVLFDDLLSDSDANSPTVINAIKETIYKGVMPALHPTKRKIIFNGTPFNKNDPIYSAVESGEWEVNVYPVCNEFPCSREEFRGSWEDRFTYEFVRDEYNLNLNSGQVKAFKQEYMLRIASEEDRVILDDDISWFNVKDVMNQKQRYNFYITTDFATSTSRKADYTVIGVWAVDKDMNRYLVDGFIGRVLMNKTFNELFRLVQKYNPMQVGIEVTGQQGGFIPLLKDEMIKRNTFFTIARARGSTKEGIAVRTNKMDRFRLTEPFFKQKKVYLPEDLKSSMLITELLEELSVVTLDGIKSVHDDVLDMVSQLDQMIIVYPSEQQANLGKEISQDTEYDPYNFNENFMLDTSSYESYLA